MLMKKNGMAMFALMMLSACLAGCGGGGGGAITTVAVSSNKALAKMALASPASQNSQIWGIQATITFPYGVTAPTDPTDPRLAAPGVIRIMPDTANSYSIITAAYTAATQTSNGKITLFVVYMDINGNGFNPTQEITTSLDVTPGFVPLTTQFDITDYSFWGKSPDGQVGALLEGITPKITSITIQ
jgi:hypothetical protein